MSLPPARLGPSAPAPTSAPGACITALSRARAGGVAGRR